MEIKRLGIKRLSGARFRRGGMTSLSLCSTSPNLPWPCLCNISHWNGASFYCGRPLNTKLGCEDFEGVSSLTWVQETILATPTEIKLMSMVVRHAQELTIKQKIHIRTDNKRKLDTNKRCSDVQAIETWNKSTSIG